MGMGKTETNEEVCIGTYSHNIVNKGERVKSYLHNGGGS